MVRRALCIGAVLAMAAVAGCSSGNGSGGSSPAPTSGTTTAPSASTSRSPSAAGTALHAGDRYVALGSSIASGYGISVQSACGRSSRDYPQLVAAKYHLKLVDVSCGAAVIPNIVDTKQGDNPPQIDAVTPDTKLITISVGGNDIEFNGTALACGNPATQCKAPANLDAQIAALPGQLRSMVAKVHAKAPGARIVFVTYPREMPVRNCSALSLTDSELAMLRSMGDRLQIAFVTALEDHAGVTFVDPYTAPGDHTVCAAAGQRWTNGYVVPTGEGFAYHPTVLGHQGMAGLIETALGQPS